MARRIFDALFTALALVLSIPTLLILISWNAIPGDRMYSLKTGLEDVVLVLFSGTPLVPEVSAKFTDRRFNEATALLEKKGSTVGYELLVAEAQQTQGFIKEKNDSQVSVKFVENIETYKQEIQKQKVQVQTQIDTGQTTPVTVQNTAPTTIIIPTPIPVDPTTTPSEQAAPAPAQTVTVTVPQTVVITQEPPQEVLQRLEDVEQRLEEIQTEVEQENEDRGNNGNRGQNFNQDRDRDEGRNGNGGGNN